MNDLRYNYQNYTMLIIKLNFVKYRDKIICIFILQVPFLMNMRAQYVL